MNYKPLYSVNFLQIHCSCENKKRTLNFSRTSDPGWWPSFAFKLSQFVQNWFFSNFIRTTITCNEKKRYDEENVRLLESFHLASHCKLTKCQKNTLYYTRLVILLNYPCEMKTFFDSVKRWYSHMRLWSSQTLSCFWRQKTFVGSFMHVILLHPLKKLLWFQTTENDRYGNGDDDLLVIHGIRVLLSFSTMYHILVNWCCKLYIQTGELLHCQFLQVLLLICMLMVWFKKTLPMVSLIWNMSYKGYLLFYHHHY